MTDDPTALPRRHSPACERNKQPILALLQRVLPARGGDALEVASGSGQHVAHFAAALPAWRWQPTDRATAPAALAELDADLDFYCAREGAGRARVLPAKRLDVLQTTDWPGLGAFDLVYCANMLHIAPWACCAALMQGAARHLEPHGLLVTYGPYFDADSEVPAAPGNVAFDADLRTRNPDWGIRQLADVTREAAQAGLLLKDRVPMPANNLCLVFAFGR